MHLLATFCSVCLLDNWDEVQASQGNKQSKHAHRHAAHHAAKAAEMRDTEAAGKWQKVQYRSKAIVKGVAS